MGRYFVIGNSTKKQLINSYWKADDWCDCYQVMHQFHWDKNDDIFSACYDTNNEFKYDETLNEMICENVTEKFLNGEFEEDNSKIIEPIQYDYKQDSPWENSNHIPNWNGDVCRVCQYKFLTQKEGI